MSRRSQHWAIEVGPHPTTAAMRVQENLRDISMGFRVWRRVVLQLDTNVSKQPAHSIFGAEGNLQDIWGSLGDEYYDLLRCDAV